MIQKKIGILTINDYTNYGNRLQNYASQELLRSLNCNVDTLIMSRRNKYILNALNTLVMFRDIIFGSDRNKISCRKVKACKNFTKNYIDTKHINYSQRRYFEKTIQGYDYFIIGSDQVWNPYFRNSEYDFLTFAPVNKRIAFAPSFGISKLPKQYYEKYRKNLNDIWCLSVREDSGAIIIKELTGREATVLVDPTLVLKKEKWLLIVRNSRKKISRDYLLTYFLGPVLAETERAISRIALNHNLEIVRMTDLRQKKYYDADPAEFLDFINSASILLTDSYHGTIFSILFERPFIVFDRQSKAPSMGTRIDTLLSKFRLENRKWSCMQESSDLFNIDYSHVPAILEYERQKAYDYLKTALNIEE